MGCVPMVFRAENQAFQVEQLLRIEPSNPCHPAGCPEVFQLFFCLTGPCQIAVRSGRQPQTAIGIHAADLHAVAPARLTISGIQDHLSGARSVRRFGSSRRTHAGGQKHHGDETEDSFHFGIPPFLLCPSVQTHAAAKSSIESPDVAALRPCVSQGGRSTCAAVLFCRQLAKPQIGVIITVSRQFCQIYSSEAGNAGTYFRNIRL